ncbi:23 kDa integral membrane protein-like [Dysidea avara]|uniref:23 kDa integral membrane protein-like n=1 Tax=Dysidea avara TaxID=196820 RepID=UPI0033186808
MGVELSGFVNCIRWFFIFSNIPILLLGLASLGLGIWQIIVESALEEVLSEDYTSGGALFIVCGIMLVAVSIVGVIGAWGKWRLLLLVYLAVVFLVIALEIAAVGYAFAKADDIDQDVIEEDLLRALGRYYPSNNTAYDEDLNDVIDFIQDSLECCGVNNTADWALFSPYTMELGRLPASCCGNDEPTACPDSRAFDEGCRDAFSDFVERNLLIIAIVGIVFAVFEVSLLVMSFFLFMAINNSIVLQRA